jgi:hypothetical protein
MHMTYFEGDEPFKHKMYTGIIKSIKISRIFIYCDAD